MSWTDLGTLSVTPSSCAVEVGAFSLAEGDDTLWVNIRKIGEDKCPWPWSYGILSWRTANGNELGSCKAYTEDNGEVFRLGVGLSPLQRTGTVIYEPRSFNLSWVKTGHPLTLNFQAQSGNTSGGGSGGERGGAVTGVLADTADSFLSYSIREDFAYLLLR